MKSPGCFFVLGWVCGGVSEGRLQCLASRLLFRPCSVQVTAQCSLIGSDCQTVFRLVTWNPGLSVVQPQISSPPPPPPPSPQQTPFIPVFESGRSCSFAISQANTTNETLTYENGPLPTFTSSLVLLVGHSLRVYPALVLPEQSDVFNYLCGTHIRPKAISPCKVQ